MIRIKCHATDFFVSTTDVTQDVSSSFCFTYTALQRTATDSWAHDPTRPGNVHLTLTTGVPEDGAVGQPVRAAPRHALAQCRVCAVTTRAHLTHRYTYTGLSISRSVLTELHSMVLTGYM